MTILFYLMLITVANNVAAVSVHPKLLVVSYDAFRHDYFDRDLTPFMKELRMNGTHSDYMMNLFVTKTFPNHYTMATGLFADVHGVVGNSVYDPDTGKPMPRNSYKMYHYNEDVAPFWIYNEKAAAGRHSGVMMWPGGHYDYLGMHPTFYQEWKSSWPMEKRVDKLISWFMDPETPINLGVLYIEDLDARGHYFGINSPVFNEVLNKLDHLTKYIHDQLNKNGLQDVNVMHVSDHGMQSVSKANIIDLSQFVNQSDYTIVDSSAGSHIFPVPGKLDLVHQQLVEGAKKTGHFTVYKKEEIPEKHHYRNNPRIGPIFILPHIRYAFNDLRDSIKDWKKLNLTTHNQSEFGVHGYSNEERDMWAMFFAYGPVFKKNCKLEPFNNTDLFPLFCKILDLSCPVVNGTLETVQNCLKTSFDVNTLESAVSIGFLMMVCLCVAIFMIIRRRSRDRRRMYQRRSVSDQGSVWDHSTLRIADSNDWTCTPRSNPKFKITCTVWWIPNSRNRWIRGFLRPPLMKVGSVFIKSKLWIRYGGEPDKKTLQMHEQDVPLLEDWS